MDKWRGKVAIVTGASSGIGAAVVRALVQHGLIVVGLARREERVKQLAEELSQSGGKVGKLHALRTDMRKEEQILDAFAWVEKELGGADILVNNAGVLYTGYMTEGDTEEWRAMFEVNVLGVAICTREYLKSMEKRKNQTGHIVIINSVAGHLAEFSKLSMYAGSKHAIKAMSMCLRRELAEKGSTIKVTSVSPGPVATEIFTGTDFEEVSKKLPLLDSADVATVIVDALSASPKSQLCDVILTPVPSSLGVY